MKVPAARRHFLTSGSRTTWGKRRVSEAGASGYITKDCEPDILLAAVRKVAAHGNHLDPGKPEEYSELL